MPGEVAGGQARTQTFVEDAFEVALNIFRIAFGCFGATEEIRRRKLLRIADHHHLLAASHGSDSIPHRNLRGLVENDQVESAGIRREILRDRQGAHQQARREFQHHRRNLFEQLTQRQVHALLGDFAA